MKNVVVLGAGNVGSYIALNLAGDRDLAVAVADNDQGALDRIEHPGITTVKADLSDAGVVDDLIWGSDQVVSTLPEFFGRDALETILESGTNVVDISFWDHDGKLPELETLAKDMGVTAFIDAGIAPGWSNGEVAYFDHQLGGRTKELFIYVASIPKSKERGFFAAWSVAGIIEEYTRDAMYVNNGEIVRVPALSLIEAETFQNVGKLDAGITDGLRTLPENLKHIPSMAEFTMRYPGYYDQMKSLRHIGYFDMNPREVSVDRITPNQMTHMLLLEIGEDKDKYEALLTELGFLDDKTFYPCAGKKVSPREVAQEVLAKAWKMRPDDSDILIMRVKANDGKDEFVSEIYAEARDGVSAAALTTGGVAATAARMMLDGKFDHAGLFPIEKVIQMQPELMAEFTQGLQALGVQYATDSGPIGYKSLNT